MRDINQISPYVASMQNVSDQVYLLLRDKKLKSLIFASALKGEGTSTIVANLGLFLSHKIRHKVLVIDANLRNPSINACLGLPDSPGLSEILEHKLSFKEAVQSIDLKEHGARRQPLTASCAACDTADRGRVRRIGHEFLG